MSRFLLIAASALVSSMMTTASQAAPGEREPLEVIGERLADDDFVVRVPYGDLQLSSEADVRTLQIRVQRATKRACTDLYRGATPTQEWGCRDRAADLAEPQIDNAIARARTGQAVSEAMIVFGFASH